MHIFEVICFSNYMIDFNRVMFHTHCITSTNCVTYAQYNSLSEPIVTCTCYTFDFSWGGG